MEIKLKKLADEYGVSYYSILSMKRGEAWSNIHVDRWKPYKKMKIGHTFESKLSDKDISIIVKMIKDGYKNKDIAREFSVHENTIYKVKRKMKRMETEIA